MKNRATALIISLLLAAGVTVHNYTDEDIVYEDGTKIEMHAMPRHLSKAFGKRDLNRPLNITFHHTAGNKKQTVESIAADQVKRGFAKFAYHFAIYEDGGVYAVNDITEVSWHDSGQNTNSIGIVFVGNYQTSELSDAALRSATQLADILCKEFKIVHIRGHRDTSPTLCPGQNAYDDLRKMFY